MNAEMLLRCGECDWPIAFNLINDASSQPDKN